ARAVEEQLDQRVELGAALALRLGEPELSNRRVAGAEALREVHPGEVLRAEFWVGEALGQLRDLGLQLDVAEQRVLRPRRRAGEGVLQRRLEGHVHEGAGVCGSLVSALPAPVDE